jgi:hypothetical protein
MHKALHMSYTGVAQVLHSALHTARKLKAERFRSAARAKEGPAGAKNIKNGKNYKLASVRTPQGEAKSVCKKVRKTACCEACVQQRGEPLPRKRVWTDKENRWLKSVCWLIRKTVNHQACVLP